MHRGKYDQFSSTSSIESQGLLGTTNSVDRFFHSSCKLNVAGPRVERLVPKSNESWVRQSWQMR